MPTIEMDLLPSSYLSEAARKWCAIIQRERWCEIMMLRDVGIVIIGRNEGERLSNCINAVKMVNGNIVYVDSDRLTGVGIRQAIRNNGGIFGSFAYFYGGKSSKRGL
jgi:hypothetical protein